MKKIYTVLLTVVVFCVFFPCRSEASRVFRGMDNSFSPENVAISNNGIKYVPNSYYDASKGRTYFIEVWDVKTEKKLWERKIYETIYDLTEEQDVQDRFITSLRVEGRKLIITNENGDVYELNLDTKEVAKTATSK